MQDRAARPAGELQKGGGKKTNFKGAGLSYWERKLMFRSVPQNRAPSTGEKSRYTFCISSSDARGLPLRRPDGREAVAVAVCLAIYVVRMFAIPGKRDSIG